MRSVTQNFRATILILALSCLGSSFSWGQLRLNLDSLQREIPHLPDTQKIRAYFEICKSWLGADKDKSIHAAEEAVRISESIQDKIWIARALNFLIATKCNHGDYGEALPLAQRALGLAREIDYKPQILESLENCSIIFSFMGFWDQTLDYAQQGLQLAQEIHDTIGILNNSNALASTYQELKQYQKAETIFKESAVLANAINRLFEKGRANANLGLLYAAQFRWKDCDEFSRRGAEDFHVLGYPTGEAQSLLNVAEAQYFLGNLEASRLICEQIIGLVKEADNPQIEAAVFAQLGKVQLEKGNHSQAAEYLQRAETEAHIVHDQGLLKSIYASLENLSVAQKDFKQAKEYQMHYEAASDSFFSQNVLSRIADFQVRYQTAEKEAQLFAQNLSLEKERNRRNILLVSLALALVSLLALYQSFRSRQKLKQKELDLAIQIEHAETEKLRELDLVKSNFFANISHEFRTPLTMILSPIEQLIDGSLKGDLQKYYYIIFRNSRRLLDLVNQLLDLSKLESGKMDLRAVEADLGQFLSVLVRSFESLAERRQIILNENIPQQPSICFFDQDKIQKILTNLLSNALKFTPEGGQVFIDFNLNDSTPLMANLVINDTGIGIPIDQVSSLFERFSRTKTSELQSGSGIGLALTKELVVLHGGQIVVESSEGNGTKISLSLAVGKSFFKEEQISTSQIEELIINPQQTKLETEGREFTAFDVLANAQDKPMLLIVEDNNDVRNYIKGQFLDLYTILEAENGKLGLDLALEKIPDVIITDVMMPEMDGIQLCTLLKTNDKTNHIPVMMLTARGDQEDKLSGLATGADDYLIKPFHAKEIQLRVANLMSRQNNLREQFQKKLYSLQPTAVQVENMDTAFIRKVKESIEAHLDEEQFSVVELSMDLGMSRSQLYRKLSALTGYSPNEVIRNMRLERAKQLLLRKAGTVSEIAYLCGFSAPAYFVKCFREYFGMTPGEIS